MASLKDKVDPLEPAVLSAVASTAAAGLGALIFGFSLGFTGPTLTAMEVIGEDTMFHDAKVDMLADGTVLIDSRQASTFSSILTIGAMLGSLSGGVLCDKFGRKNTIMAAAVPFMLSWFIIGTTTHYPMFLSARCLIGFTVGVVSMAVPLYISESAPTHLRGALGAVNQLEVTIGILLAYAVGYAAEKPQQTRVACGWVGEDFWTSDMGDSAVLGRDCGEVVAGWTCRDPSTGKEADLGGESCGGAFSRGAGLCFCEGHLPQWRVLAWVATGLSAALFTAMAFAPETPSFLLLQQTNAIERANRVATAMVPTLGVPDEDDLDPNPWVVLWNRLSERRSSLRQPLAVGIALMVFQQFSGINAIIFYSGSILEESGVENSNLGGVIVMAVQVAFTFLSVLLMDKLERRFLMGVSAIGLVVALAALSFFFANDKRPAWLAIFSLVVYVAAFSLGLGPIPWLVMSEIFPADVRSPACALATLANWGSGFIVTAFFHDMLAAFESTGVFLFFAGFCVLCLVFVLLYMPETRGRTLAEIEDLFTSRLSTKGSIDTKTQSPLCTGAVSPTIALDGPDAENTSPLASSKEQGRISIIDPAIRSSFLQRCQQTETPSIGNAEEQGRISMVDPAIRSSFLQRCQQTETPATGNAEKSVVKDVSASVGLC